MRASDVGASEERVRKWENGSTQQQIGRSEVRGRGNRGPRSQYGRPSIGGFLLVIAVAIAAIVSQAGYTAWLLGVLGAVLIIVGVRFAVWLRRGSALH